MNENHLMVPKISVCIPTYNYAHYIPFAIESIRSHYKSRGKKKN